MINKETVLIFGAGVSFPYGYPLGLGLIRKIRDSIKSSRFDFLISKELPKVYIEKFANELNDSQLPSIDIFLENRKTYKELGRICILIELLACENPYYLFEDKRREEGVYQDLFYTMVGNGGWREFHKNRVKIINFNYDRSFKHFLFKTLKTISGEDDETVKDMVNSIQIINVYGSLPKLEWESNDGIKYGEFYDFRNVPTNFEELKQLSKEIIIFSDEIGEEFLFEKSFEILSKAEQIVLFGFGYHDINLERLRLKDLKILDKDCTLRKSIKRPVKIFRGNAFRVGKEKTIDIEKEFGLYIPTTTMEDIKFLNHFINLK